MIFWGKFESSVKIHVMLFISYDIFIKKMVFELTTFPAYVHNF